VFPREAAAQPAAPEVGTLTTASFDSRLEFSDNFDLRPDPLGNAVIWDNTFAYGVERNTRVESFAADLQGTLRAADLPSQGTEFSADDPRVALSYARRGSDSELSFEARFRTNDLDFFDPLSDLDEEGNFDETRDTDGRRLSYNAAFGAELNQNGPVRLSLDARFSRVEFTDVAAASDLDNRTVASARAELGFRISPVLELTTSARYRDRTVDDDENTRRRVAGAELGANAQINPRMLARARLGYARTETEGDTRDDSEEGLTGGLDLVIERPAGETRLGADVTVDESGQRTTLSVGNSIERPLSTIDAEIGVAFSEGTDARAVGRLGYTYALERTRIEASLRQTATVDEDGDDTLNTFGDLSLTRTLTRLSQLNLSVLGARSDFEDEDRDTRTRLDINATYSRTITREWNWNVGYRRRLSEGDGEDSAVSNALVLGLSRDFRSVR